MWGMLRVCSLIYLHCKLLAARAVFHYLQVQLSTQWGLSFQPETLVSQAVMGGG